MTSERQSRAGVIESRRFKARVFLRPVRRASFDCHGTSVFRIFRSHADWLQASEVYTTGIKSAAFVFLRHTAALAAPRTGGEIAR